MSAASTSRYRDEPRDHDWQPLSEPRPSYEPAPSVFDESARVEQQQHRRTRPVPLAPESLAHSFGMALWPDHLRRDTHSHSPMSAKRRRQLVLSYLPDWIAAVALLIIFGLIDKVDGFKREFSLTDTSIQHTFATSERVPMWLLGVVAIVIPVVIIIFISIVFRRSFWDMHNGLLGFILAQAFTWVVTDAVKITVGRPRPDLIDRCQPGADAANLVPYGLATAARVCGAADPDRLKDGFRSFPSGHSSAAFAGLGFLSFYLAGKLHLFDHRGHSLKSWAALFPLLGAALIAISRTMDARHHATDVIAGSLLGFFLALWAYLLYYPSLRSPVCHLPYSPRIPAESNGTASPTKGPFDTLNARREGARLDDGLMHPEHGTAPRPSSSEPHAPVEQYSMV